MGWRKGRKTEKRKFRDHLFSLHSLFSFIFLTSSLKYDVTNYLFFICPFIYTSNEWLLTVNSCFFSNLCHAVWWSERNVEELMLWNKQYLNDSSIFSIMFLQSSLFYILCSILSCFRFILISQCAIMIIVTGKKEVLLLVALEFVITVFYMI